MKKLKQPAKQILVGTFPTLKAASKQVDLLMSGNAKLCANIVRTCGGFSVRTMVWK